MRHHFEHHPAQRLEDTGWPSQAAMCHARRPDGQGGGSGPGAQVVQEMCVPRREPAQAPERDCRVHHVERYHVGQHCRITHGPRQQLTWVPERDRWVHRMERYRIQVLAAPVKAAVPFLYTRKNIAILNSYF